MPSVTYLGPSYTRTKPGKGASDFIRGDTLEVSQDWLNEWRMWLSPEQFRIEGDEGVTVDDGDGLPDSGWNRKDILTWLKEKGVESGSTYLTKSAALTLVQQTLNPPAPEPVEEAIVEDNTTGI